MLRAPLCQVLGIEAPILAAPMGFITDVIKPMLPNKPRGVLSVNDRRILNGSATSRDLSKGPSRNLGIS
jgi:hypothetical protein